jgi:transmembrane sensor
MTSNDKQVRAAIADKAAEWLVANDDGPLDEREAAGLAAWLRASPVHVEEFLGVAVVARDLREAGSDPEFSVEAVLAGARAEDDTAVRPLWPRLSAPLGGLPSRRWLTAAATLAALAVLSIGLFSLWSARRITPASVPDGATALHFETRHGEQLSRRLTDSSVLHLNTDSAVTIRYSKTERLVTLTYGQADFEVAHDPRRAFRVFAGSAEVIAIGTKFDVKLEHDSTLVTVVEGRVRVGPSPLSGKLGAHSGASQLSQFIQLGADQQIRVAEGAWPASPANIDAQRVTAWLHRQIVFDEEPLASVAAEFNRYAPKPIEIVTPALRNLQISGVFATDDTEAFIAFLRSLKGVRVEVTPTLIRVSGATRAATRDYT